MFYPYISGFNWIDLWAISIILRMCYIGIKRGLGIEIFKTLNLLFCSFVSLHFYYALGELFHSILKPFPVEPASVFSYILLLSAITLIFRVLRESFFVFFKIETIGTLSKVLGCINGVFRGIVITGLIAYGLLISNNHYFDLSTRTSILGSKFLKVPIKIYESLLNGVTVPIFPDQSFNTQVVKVLKKNPKNKNVNQ